MASDRYSKEFGRRVKKLRLEHDWSRRQLAERLDVHPAQISRYEAGESAPSLWVLRGLCEAFHVTADELVFGARRRAGGELEPLFTAIQALPAAEKKTVREVLEALIARFDQKRLRRKKK